jgi:hypothetical protein
MYCDSDLAKATYRLVTHSSCTFVAHLQHFCKPIAIWTRFWVASSLRRWFDSINIFIRLRVRFDHGPTWRQRCCTSLTQGKISQLIKCTRSEFADALRLLLAQDLRACSVDLSLFACSGILVVKEIWDMDLNPLRGTSQGGMVSEDDLVVCNGVFTSHNSTYSIVHTPGPANPLFTGPNIILIHRRSQIISMIVTCLYNGVFTSRNFRHFFIKKVRITVPVCLHT